MDKSNEMVTLGISDSLEVKMEGSVSLGCLKLEHGEIRSSENGLDKAIEGVVGEIGFPDNNNNIPSIIPHLGSEEGEMNSHEVEWTDECGKVEEVMGKVSIGDLSSDNIVEADISSRKGVSGNVVEIVGKSGDCDEVTMSNSTEETIINGRTVNGDKTKGNEDDGSSSDSDSESDSSSSSSASSSDDDEEEDDESSSNEEVVEDVDMEEGEIEGSDPDEMVAWDEDDEDYGAKGPIKSKNEVQVLPPVPAVTASLEPHHQMLPIGVVSSILGAQIVVEGVEKHSPLNDGSILWITESRCPLGIVDEIFGPVKNPYYIVRYNSENEIPPGINPGTLISFVPEFAKHVLNDNSLYKKGYDASNENDEEVTEEEEFSDDEKEAKYKRMLKMKRRSATNDQKAGNRKNDNRKHKNRSRNWKHDQDAAKNAPSENAKPPVDHHQRFIPAPAGSLDQGNHPNNSFQAHGQSSRPPSAPPGLPAQSAGAWTNGISYQQPQNMGFPNTMPPMGGMPWPQQSHPQQMFQMPLPNGVPFEQQINPTLQSSFFFPVGQPNFGGGPSFAPWPAVGQNSFSQAPLTMGLPGQLAPSPMIFGGQMPVNGPQMGQNSNSQPHAADPGYSNGSPNFNQGTHSDNDRRGNHRGGGRFGGRRGRSQRN